MSHILEKFRIYGHGKERQASCSWDKPGQSVSLIFSRQTGWMLTVYLHLPTGEVISSCGHVTRGWARITWYKLRQAQAAQERAQERGAPVEERAQVGE